MVVLAITEVKEGQIFASSDNKNIYIIKNISPETITLYSNEDKESNQNIAGTKNLDFKDMQLIAKYNTWQEGIISKEFKVHDC